IRYDRYHPSPFWGWSGRGRGEESGKEPMKCRLLLTTWIALACSATAVTAQMPLPYSMPGTQPCFEFSVDGLYLKREYEDNVIVSDLGGNALLANDDFDDDFEPGFDVTAQCSWVELRYFQMNT